MLASGKSLEEVQNKAGKLSGLDVTNPRVKLSMMLDSALAQLEYAWVFMQEREEMEYDNSEHAIEHAYSTIEYVKIRMEDIEKS